MLTRLLIIVSVALLGAAGCSKTDREVAPSTNPGSAAATGDTGETEAGASDPAAASTPHQQEATGTTEPPPPTGESPATPHQEEATKPNTP
jgi:hypothetical protein